MWAGATSVHTNASANLCEWWHRINIGVTIGFLDYKIHLD